MKKSILIPGVIGIFLLLIALLFRHLQMPNQILLIIPGVVCIFLVGHIAYVVFRMSEKKSIAQKIIEWLLFLWMLALTAFLLFYFYSHIKAVFMIAWGILLAVSLAFCILPSIRRDSPSKKIHFWFTAIYIFSILLLWLTNPIEFQIPDKTYNPPIENPIYPNGEGSLILVDDAHHNFHTISGRFYAFANVLRKDGYRVESLSESISPESLRDCQILVIANAQNERNVEHWSNPIYPAFTEDEIDVLEHWVANGGNLFLIADHMPMPGAVAGIGERFGFTLHNGFNRDSIPGPELFTRTDGTVFPSELLTSLDGVEIDSFYSFTGHGFDYPAEATPVFLFKKGSFILLPDVAWDFHPETPRMDAEGMSQLAYKKHGKGKVVVSGEAAMFTSQCFGGLSWKKGGMGSAIAQNNYKLLLNIIHWLDGLYD